MVVDTTPVEFLTFQRTRVIAVAAIDAHCTILSGFLVFLNSGYILDIIVKSYTVVAIIHPLHIR